MGNQFWETPTELISTLEENQGVKFTIDLSATKENKKAPLWVGPGSSIAEDLLAWNPPFNTHEAWLNPPYENLAPWAEWVARNSPNFTSISVLVPGDFSTKWWETFYKSANVSLLLTPRVGFVNPDTGKPVQGNPKPNTLFCYWRDGTRQETMLYRWK